MSNVTSIDDLRMRLARRKTEASKARADAAAKSAIAYLNSHQREANAKAERDRWRDGVEDTLRLACEKAYACFPEPEADKMLMQMLPFVQSAVKLKMSGGVK